MHLFIWEIICTLWQYCSSLPPHLNTGQSIRCQISSNLSQLLSVYYISQPYCALLLLRTTFLNTQIPANSLTLLSCGWLFLHLSLNIEPNTHELPTSTGSIIFETYRMWKCLEWNHFSLSTSMQGKFRSPFSSLEKSQIKFTWPIKYESSRNKNEFQFIALCISPIAFMIMKSKIWLQFWSFSY